MPELTLQELEAMQLQIKRGYAAIEAPRLTEAQEILTRLAASADVERLAVLVGELPPSGISNGIANVGAAIAASAANVAIELPKVLEMLPAPEGGGGEGGA